MTEIMKRDSQKSALLVVDMQKGVVAAAFDRAKVIANINMLVKEARAKHVPVLWVQHSADDMKRDSENWKIVDELKPLGSEVIIHKIHGDSFEATDLETELAKLGVRKLIVTGAQTDACIRSTIHGAFTRGYDTTLVSDAHTTEDMTAYGFPSPEQLIQFTNSYWKFQSAPNRTASVIKSADVSF